MSSSTGHMLCTSEDGFVTSCHTLEVYLKVSKQRAKVLREKDHKIVWQMEEKILGWGVIKMYYVWLIFFRTAAGNSW